MRGKAAAPSTRCREGAGPVHLLGHSRGGHLAFRVAQQRPDLLRKLILAEPGGDLDASLALTDTPVPSRGPLRAHVAAAAESVRVPTLFIGGQDTTDSLPRVLRALAAHVQGARIAMIPQATRMMFEDDPVRFCGAVLDFLGVPGLDEGF